MIKGLKLFEKTIILALMAMMVVVVIVATVELGRLLITDLLDGSEMLIDINQLLDIFGFFLLILIGVELLETIKAYLAEHVVHVEIVTEVALIAVARKVIVLDVKEVKPEVLWGVAGLIIAIAVAFYLQKRGRREELAVRSEKPVERLIQ